MNNRRKKGNNMATTIGNLSLEIFIRNDIILVFCWLPSSLHRFDDVPKLHTKPSQQFVAAKLGLTWTWTWLKCIGIPRGYSRCIRLAHSNWNMPRAFGGHMRLFEGQQSDFIGGENHLGSLGFQGNPQHRNISLILNKGLFFLSYLLLELQRSSLEDAPKGFKLDRTGFPFWAEFRWFLTKSSSLASPWNLSLVNLCFHLNHFVHVCVVFCANSSR